VDWQQIQILLEGLFLLPRLAAFAFAVFVGAGSVVVFLVPGLGQGVDLQTRPVSTQDSELERAFCLDWERHGQGTNCPFGGEGRLAEESYEEETVLVRGLPIDHLVAGVAASVPYSVVLTAGVAGSCQAAAAGLER